MVDLFAGVNEWLQEDEVSPVSFYFHLESTLIPSSAFTAKPKKRLREKK